MMTQQPPAGFRPNIPTKLECLKAQIDLVCEKDVLFGGHGDSVDASHPGNRLLLETIDNYLDEFLNAKTKLKQTRICQRIMGIMRRQYGSRFLLKDMRSGRWIQMEERPARDRIGLICRRSFSTTTIATTTSNNNFEEEAKVPGSPKDSGSDGTSVNSLLEPIALNDVGDWIEDSLVDLHQEDGSILQHFLRNNLQHRNNNHPRTDPLFLPPAPAPTSGSPEHNGNFFW